MKNIWLSNVSKSGTFSSRINKKLVTYMCNKMRLVETIFDNSLPWHYRQVNVCWRFSLASSNLPRQIMGSSGLWVAIVKTKISNLSIASNAHVAPLFIKPHYWQQCRLKTKNQLSQKELCCAQDFLTIYKTFSIKISFAPLILATLLIGGR